MSYEFTRLEDTFSPQPETMVKLASEAIEITRQFVLLLLFNKSLMASRDCVFIVWISSYLWCLWVGILKDSLDHSRTTRNIGIRITAAKYSTTTRNSAFTSVFEYFTAFFPEHS